MKKSEVNLYFIKSDFEKIAYKLCKSLVSKGFRVILNLKNKEELHKLDSFFWSYEKVSFLQHLTCEDETDFGINPLFLSYGEISKWFISRKYDIVICSPETLLKKLNLCQKFFFFSYIEKNINYEEINNNLTSKGFFVKTFIETEKFKWKKI